LVVLGVSVELDDELDSVSDPLGKSFGLSTSPGPQAEAKLLITTAMKCCLRARMIARSGSGRWSSSSICLGVSRVKLREDNTPGARGLALSCVPVALA
jgi:hypothetical protein